jgi:hypothetical protein
LLAALAGLGAGAAAGGLVGGLVGLGIPEHHAMVMDKQITRGGILVACGVDDRDQQHAAEAAFERAGAATTSTAST